MTIDLDSVENRNWIKQRRLEFDRLRREAGLGPRDDEAGAKLRCDDCGTWTAEVEVGASGRPLCMDCRRSP